MHVSFFANVLNQPLVSIPVFKSVPGMDDPILSMVREKDRLALTSPSGGKSAMRTMQENVVQPQQGKSAKKP